MYVYDLCSQTLFFMASILFSQSFGWIALIQTYWSVSASLSLFRSPQPMVNNYRNMVFNIYKPSIKPTLIPVASNTELFPIQIGWTLWNASILTKLKDFRSYPWECDVFLQCYNCNIINTNHILISLRMNVKSLNLIFLTLTLVIHVIVNNTQDNMLNFRSENIQNLDTGLLQGVLKKHSKDLKLRLNILSVFLVTPYKLTFLDIPHSELLWRCVCERWWSLHKSFWFLKLRL